MALRLLPAALKRCGQATLLLPISFAEAAGLT